MRDAAPASLARVDRRHGLGIALVLLSACAFGSGPLFAKPVYAAGVDWHVLSALRFLFGASLAWLWILVSPSRRATLGRLPRRAVLVALALGALYTGNSGTYYAGLETVSASLAALIVYVYPALVAVASLRFGRRLEGRRAWAALGLALLGVALSVGGIPAGEAPPLSGLALIIASPVIYAAWIVLSAHLSGERRADARTGQTEAGAGEDERRADSGLIGGEGPAAPAAARAGTEAAAATALMMTATATIYWITAVVGGRPVAPAAIPADAWPGLVGVGMVATFIAIQSFYAGAQRVGAAQAALISTVEPLYTIALATFLFGESLGPVQVLGGMLIIVGVVVAQTSGAAVRRPRLRMRLADE